MEAEGGKPGKAEGSEASEKEAPRGSGEPSKSAPKDSKPKAAKPADKAAGNRRMLRIGIVALALIVGVIAWVASKGDDGESTAEPAAAGIEAKIVSVEELEEFAADSAHEIYWAGPLPGKVIELSESDAGNVQLRYLDEGTGAGEGGRAVLTVGSYPLPDPEAAVKGFGERKGSFARKGPEGREIAFSAEKPTSVYFAGEGNEVQVEVYDPNYKRALSLALSDQVRPVG